MLFVYFVHTRHRSSSSSYLYLVLASDFVGFNCCWSVKPTLSFASAPLISHCEQGPHLLLYYIGVPILDLLTPSRRARTPSLNLSNTGIVLSQLIQATAYIVSIFNPFLYRDPLPSVTDRPYFKPEGPVVGMSCLPSTRFDSIITPIIKFAVSEVSSCCALRSHIIMGTKLR